MKGQGRVIWDCLVMFIGEQLMQQWQNELTQVVGMKRGRGRPKIILIEVVKMVCQLRK